MKSATMMMTLGLLFCISAVVHGDTLLAIQGSGLYRVNTDTLTAELIGSTGFTAVGGLTIDQDGVLYAVGTFNDELIMLDPVTGAGTLVGELSHGFDFSTGLAINPVNGDLYGVASNGIRRGGVLVTISKQTGVSSLVGDTGEQSIAALEFDSLGQLWGIDGFGFDEELILINPQTASTSIIAAKGLAPFPNIGGFAIGPNGRFWAINYDNQFELIEINPTTGTGSIAGIVSGFSGTAIVTGMVAVPELGSAAVMSGMCFLGLIRYRRARERDRYVF